MRIEQLEYIVAVTQHGSLRKASEHLHISQPALSEAVVKLERELGVPLLERRRTGSRISRQGQELLGGMVEVLDSVRRLKVAAGDQTTTTRLVTVGTDHSASGVLLPALRDFRDQHPDAAVEVGAAHGDTLRTGVLEGRFDLSLRTVLEGDAPGNDLVTTVLRRGSVVAALPADHPLARRGRLSADDLRTARLVITRPGHLMHQFAGRLLGSTPATEVHHADSTDLSLSMVAAGLGLTLLPDHTAFADPHVRSGALVTRSLDAPGTGTSLIAQHRMLPVPLRVRYLHEHLTGAATSLAEAVPA